MNKNVRKIVWSILVIMIFLLLYFSFFIIKEFSHYGENSNITLLLNSILFAVTLLGCCVILALILIKNKLFDKSVWTQGKILSIIYFAAAAIFPRFKGYQTNFEIFAQGDFILIDGRSLTFGILIALLSYVFYVGAKNQEEIDSIL